METTARTMSIVGFLVFVASEFLSTGGLAGTITMIVSGAMVAVSLILFAIIGRRDNQKDS